MRWDEGSGLIKVDDAMMRNLISLIKLFVVKEQSVKERREMTMYYLEVLQYCRLQTLKPDMLMINKSGMRTGE